jgi:hypothetical protein
MNVATIIQTNAARYLPSKTASVPKNAATAPHAV